MDPEDLKLLQDEIAKWEGIIKGTDTDRGRQNCGLCQKYFSKKCVGCPTNMGKGECTNTPYIEWHEHKRNDKHHGLYFDTNILYKRMDKMIECPKCKEIATKELNFLKSIIEF